MNFVKKGGKAIILDVKGKNVKGFNRELKNVTKDQIPFNIELQGKWAHLEDGLPNHTLLQNIQSLLGYQQT